MKYLNFKSDDMIRDGFSERTSQNVVKMRIVEKTRKSYNEMVIENGILIMQVCDIATQSYEGHETNLSRQLPSIGEPTLTVLLKI